MSRLEFRLSNGLPWSDSIGVHIRHMAGGVPAYAQPVVFSTVEEGLIQPPALSISNQAAQELMDELWRCGLRPSEGSGSAGSLAATERHLADMRTLAFKAMKVKP